MGQRPTAAQVAQHQDGFAQCRASLIQLPGDGQRRTEVGNGRSEGLCVRRSLRYRNALAQQPLRFVKLSAVRRNDTETVE